MRWIKLAAALSVAVALGQAAPRPAKAGEPETVTMTISSVGLYYMAHYVAEDAGLFTKEGIKIDLVDVPSGARQIASVMGGAALGTIVNIEGAILAQQQGGDLVAIGGLYNVYPMVLVVSNDVIKKTGMTPAMSIDDKVKKLRGLKIGITSPGSGSDNFIRTVLKARNIDPDTEVTLVPLGGIGPNQYVAFEHGAVDAAVWSSPMPELAEKQGLGTAIIDPFLPGAKIEYDVEPYTNLIVSRSSLQTKRKELTAILRAYAEALKLIRTDPDRARALVRKHYPDADDAVFNAGFAKYLSQLPKTLVITEQQYDTTLAAMSARRSQPLTVKYGEAVDNELAAEVSKEILGP